MSKQGTCEHHAWASVGVLTREGTVCRIWECEQCPAWTAERFASDTERPRDDTWLAER